MKTHFLMDSPIGVLTLVNSDGVLCGLYMTQHKYGPRSREYGERSRSGFDRAVAELREYFDRKRTGFSIPLVLEGTPFQERVWDLLRKIPHGETRTYAQLAKALGKPTAFRAVGLANGHNPISIVVPCHRVVGSDHGLTGYGGGLERKKFLLELEGVPVSQQLELI